MSSGFWGLFDQNSGNNSTFDPTGDPPQEITFVPKGDDGDLILESGGNKVDPDTQVMIDGETYDFKFDKTGTMPEGGDYPPEFYGQEVAMITIVDFPEPGDSTRMIFFPEMDPDEEMVGEIGDGSITLEDVDKNPDDLPVCFVDGTLIDTPDGRRPVESLKPGDIISLADGGTAKLRWVSKSHFSFADLLCTMELRPVCVPGGSLGNGVPEADLWVSQQHRIALRGWQVEMLTTYDAAFAMAKQITETPGFPGAEWRDGVDYYHLLLDRHEVILANGAPAESLYLGVQVAKTLDDEARRELTALLGEDPALLKGFRQTCLPELKAHEARTWAKMAAGEPVFRDLVGQAA